MTDEKQITSASAIYNKYSHELETVVEISHVKVPQLEKGQVLVKVHSASINPIDYKLIAGYFISYLSSTFPKGIGFDFAGVVDKVGPDSNKFKVGDEVVGIAFTLDSATTCTEYYVAQENSIALKPANLSFNEAASLPLAALTSYQALLTHGKLKKGDRVLILGGSGGTGIYGVQIAKAIGAYVATTCSTKNVELVKSLGADQVIDYTSQNWAEELKGGDFDVVYDTVGASENWTNAQHVMKSTGEFLTIASDPRVKIEAPNYRRVMRTPNEDDLHSIAKLAGEGKLKAIIDSVYPLEKTLDALKRSSSRRAVGKIVVITKFHDDYAKVSA